MVCAVSLVPTPATTVARSPRAPSTASRTACCSPSLIVGDSPVVPKTTRPSCDCRSTRWAASSWAPARSIEPSSASGVTIAVSTRPKGRAGSLVMPRIYRPAPADTSASVAARTYSDTAYRRPVVDVAQPVPGVRDTRAHPARSAGAHVSPSTSVSTSVTTTRSACGRNAAYTRPPPITHRSPASSRASTCATSAARSAPSAAQEGSVVRTTLRRPGRGRNRSGRESQVRRPMITVDPVVSPRNSRRSSGRCHGSRPSAPITPPRACAQTRPSTPLPATRASDRHRGADRRVVPVVAQGEVLVGVAEQRRRRGQVERREGQHLAGELLAHLVDVVAVDVAIAADPDEVAWGQAHLVGDHPGEQRVAGDVERHAEEHVRAALVQLAGQPPAGDVELEQRVAGRERHLGQRRHVPGRDDHAPGIGV